MHSYFELLTEEDLGQIKKMHPKEAKLKLATLVVSQYYSEKEAKEEKEQFQKVFGERKLPDEMPTFKIDTAECNLIQVLVKSGLAESGNAARRLLKQKAIKIDDRVVLSEAVKLERKESILKAGKRKFLKLVKN